MSRPVVLDLEADAPAGYRDAHAQIPPHKRLVTRSETWDRLRLSRSLPPGAAEQEGQRAELYRAALGQFEELMVAAQATGPAARPLPLYYAVSQAGRAIVACRGGGEHHGHGLTLPEPEFDGSPLDVKIHVAKPWGKKSLPGHFQAVSECLGSPPLQSSTTLGALIASLPELIPYLPDDAAWPHPLEVLPATTDAALSFQRGSEWTTVVVRFDREVANAKEAMSILALYPHATDKWRPFPKMPQLARVPASDGCWETQLQWNDAGKGMDGIVPRYRSSWWLRPAVATSDAPPYPLMTWWAISFALSMLARYHPVPWVAALDLNHSRVAVLLDRCMSKALDMIPELVLAEVLRQTA